MGLHDLGSSSYQADRVARESRHGQKDISGLGSCSDSEIVGSPMPKASHRSLSQM